MTALARAALAAAIVFPGAVLAMAPHVVSQLGRRFSMSEISLHRGEAIRFENIDEFSHHIYIRSPRFQYDSGEQKPGTNLEVTFTVPGQFEVRCDIHPKMLLKVSVE